MKLNSVELQGFKSFVDKTRIDFTDGMTAIVGPNGSGKSNIIEAIRWVMGETSAKSLRSDKMTDVIFSGTANRAPVNIAQVTLSLDNSDYFLPSDHDRLDISRRIKKDGSSDYYINQQAVRQKDIHDLFMDSGLGRDSFSVIGQGKVDQILNEKPEDRRLIIEEAAGVLKYKLRKKEAQSNLDQTRDNLDRVKDILFEIDKQRDQLEEEAAKANHYLSLDKDYRKVAIQVLAFDIQKDEVLFTHLQEKNQSLIDQLKQVNQTIQTAEDQVQAWKLQSHQLDQDRTDLHQDQVATVKSIEQTESQILLIEERRKNFSKDKSRMDNLHDQLDEDIRQQEGQLLDLTQQGQDLNAQLDQMQASLKKKKEQLDQLSGSKEEALADLKTRQFDLLREESRLNNEMTYLDKAQSQILGRLSRLERESATLESDRDKIKLQIKEVQDKLESSKALSQEEKSQLSKLVDQVEVMNQDFRKLDDRVLRLRQSYQEKEAQKNSLQAMKDNYSNYYQGVQAVMKAQESLSGIVGTVAESIHVEERYNQAINTALSSAAQFIIVKSHQDAEAAIAYLKQGRRGRATFLPLNRMKARDIPDQQLAKIEGQEGYIGVASQIIDYHPDLYQVIENLLGHILVTDTITTANRISGLIHQRYRVVTLEGDVVNVGGSLSGGAQKRQATNPILSQDDRLKGLEENLRKITQEGQALQEDKKKLQSKLEKLIAERDQLQEDLQENSQQDHQLSYQKDQLQDRLDQAEKSLRAHTFDLSQDREEEEENRTRLEQVKKEKDQLAKDLVDNEQAMADVENNWADRKLKYDDLADELSKEESQVNELKVNQASLKNEEKMLRQQVEKLKQDRKLNQADLESLLSDQKNLSPSLLQEQLDQLKKDQADIGERADLLDQQKLSLQKKIDSADQSLADDRLLQSDLQEQKSQVDLSMAKSEERLKRLLADLNEDFQVSYEDLEDQNLDQDQVEAKRQQAQQVKQEIKQLGPVNLASIDDYEDIKERSDFLNQQRDDLLEAREDLMSTMNEMDQHVIDRFQETFTAVQAKFSEIFPKIFGGGRAQLILTDPEDLLHSGIDIKAQPPGKNLRSLNLLSGGERTLTAISLLFAIIQTNPIPFVILDEVEAALDDANVLRFSHYLKNLSEMETQFLVITHRKGTMEAADTLYGVVMQERGVSSILSVHLAEAEKLID